MTPTKRPFRFTWILIVISVIAVCAGIILYSIGNSGTARRVSTDADALKLLREAYTAIMERHVEKPDSKTLVLKMVEGMLASLDPHSVYLPPEPLKAMTFHMSGSFGGVGIELGTKGGKLTVVAPIDDTPASRAGIQANDHIWKIDGKSTNGMNINDAVKLMRGEKDTPVTLAILRGDSPKPLIFNLIRNIIKLKSLKVKLLDSGYGLIRIAQFQERTAADFKEALQTLHTQAGGDLKGLIIDLRYNPGGLVNSCVDVANCFLGDDITKKSVIVSTKGKGPGANHEYLANLGTKEPYYPIVILINGGSASASEILAGALQDHKRAIVLGTQSFGKGSVQSIIPMKGNAALKLTTALYYTPSGRSIQAKGITPDVEVPNIQPLPANTKGEELKEKDLAKSLPAETKEEPVAAQPPKAAPSPHDVSAEAGDLQKDFQLRRAVELLQAMSVMKEKGFH